MIRPFGALVLLTAIVTPASGRLIESWPYKKLFKEADLVVIATAKGTEDTAERLKKAGGWDVELVGRNTTFKVEAVLKGKVGGDTFKVLHYRLPEGVLVQNGPLLVSFRTKPIMIVGKIDGEAAKVGLGRPQYMLFLKARKDGRYEPVSGQIDPELSVREVGAPFPRRLGK
jgi:hypothetical protein